MGSTLKQQIGQSPSISKKRFVVSKKKNTFVAFQSLSFLGENFAYFMQKKVNFKCLGTFFTNFILKSSKDTTFFTIFQVIFTFASILLKYLLKL